MRSTTAPKSPETTAAAPERKVRFALVGLGHIAQVAVLPGFRQARCAEITALVSGHAAKLKQLKKRYGVGKTFTYEEFDACLADPDIDAVYIALPNDLHVDCALRAAAAGKHILCEKPLASSLRDAQLMTRVAKQNDVRLMTAYRLHYEPATLAALEHVRGGKIGEIRYFNSSFSYQVTDPDNIRLRGERAGGPVFDIGIYCLNAARMLMGDEPTEVSAFLARSGDPRFAEVEETAAVILRFPRGRLASFVVSFGSASVSRYEIVGTLGHIVMQPAFEYAEALKQIVTIAEKPEEKTFPHTDQFGGEIDAFSRCILEGTTPEPSGEEGIADLRVIEAIFESAATGRAVRLRPFRRTDRPDPHKAEKKPAVKQPQTVQVDSPHD